MFTEEDRASGLDEHEYVTADADVSADDDRWLIRSDGSRFWAAGVLVTLRDGDGNKVGYGKILRNRTDIREQIETLRNQAAASELRHHHKDVFFSTLAHELRNPLAPLSNAVELIRLAVPPSADIEFPMRILERQIASLRTLVDDLMDLSRIGAGKVDIEKVPLSLQSVIQHAAESVQPLIREHRHELKLLLPPSPMTVSGDPTRLEQVFVNLLTNAAKYTPEGGSIWIKSTIEGVEAVTHVTDNGIGIPTDMLPKIFELFTQVDGARPRSRGGLGIGLSLVRNLVALHGGSVQVRSDGEGRGSEFSVRLPLMTG
jgi:signal transduction histidine kinase